MSGTLLLLLGLGAVFVAITIALATIGALTSERAAVNRSLAAVEAINAAPASMRRELDKPFGERVVNPTMDRLTRIGRRFTPTERSGRHPSQAGVGGQPARLGRRPRPGLQGDRRSRPGARRVPALARVRRPGAHRDHRDGARRTRRVVHPQPGALPGRLQPQRAHPARAARRPRPAQHLGRGGPRIRRRACPRSPGTPKGRLRTSSSASCRRCRSAPAAATPCAPSASERT